MRNKSNQIEAVKILCRQTFHRLRCFIDKRIDRKTSVIGLDIGRHSIKAVQVEHEGGRPTLVRSSLAAIEGDPADKNKILESLNKALAGMNKQDAQIMAVINCPETCTRSIIVPHMPKHELAQAIRWEAKNVIPYSIETAAMDFKVWGEVLENGVKKLSVVMAASPKETVQQMVSLCSGAGRELSALIPVSAAHQNLLAHLDRKSTRLNSSH